LNNVLRRLEALFVLVGTFVIAGWFAAWLWGSYVPALDGDDLGHGANELLIFIAVGGLVSGAAMVVFMRLTERPLDKKKPKR
jgi:hypothetical protein